MSKSFFSGDANGYMVLSVNVIALRKVFGLERRTCENGSFTGKRREPQRTVCSRIWATPLLSSDGVLNMNTQQRSWLLFLMWKTSIPVP